MYCVRCGSTAVECVRVKEVTNNYVRAYINHKQSRRESWKSLFHEYFYFYEEAKQVLIAQFESQVADLRAQLAQAEENLRVICITTENHL